MKNLKKFVALLLAGVMAMVLFTACTGGGNTGSNLKEDTTAESTVLSKYSTASVDNNKELKDKAEKFLDEKLKASGSILGYKFVLGYKVEGKTENAEFLTVLVAANFSYEDTMLGAILTQISQKIRTDTNVNINQKGTWTDIGVVVKGDSKQSYMAVAFKVKNPNYVK